MKLQHADEDLRKLLTSARDQIKAVLDTDELFRDAMNLWYNRMLQLAVQDENFAAQEDSITPAGFTSALLDDEIEPIDGISSGIDQLSSITVILAEYEVQVWRINAHWQDSSIPIAERIRRVLAEEHAGTENEPKDASLNTQGQSSPLGDLERMRQLRECLRELVEQLDVIMGLMDDYSVVEKHKAAIEAFLENYLEFEEQPAGSQLPEQPVAEYSQTEHALDTEWLGTSLTSGNMTNRLIDRQMPCYLARVSSLRRPSTMQQSRRSTRGILSLAHRHHRPPGRRQLQLQQSYRAVLPSSRSFETSWSSLCRPIKGTRRGESCLVCKSRLCRVANYHHWEC